MGRTAVNRWILWQVVFALCARCAALGACCTVYVIVVILLPGLHFPTTHSGRVGRRCATPCLPSAQYWSLFLFSLSWLPGPQQISHSPKEAKKRIITVPSHMYYVLSNKTKKITVYYFAPTDSLSRALLVYKLWFTS